MLSGIANVLGRNCLLVVARDADDSERKIGGEAACNATAQLDRFVHLAAEKIANAGADKSMTLKKFSVSPFSLCKANNTTTCLSAD